MEYAGLFIFTRFHSADIDLAFHHNTFTNLLSQFRT